MDVRGFIVRIQLMAKGLARKLRRPEPGSVRRLLRPKLAPTEHIPADPGEHAEDFALRYYELLENYSRRRMRELGIPNHRIGAYDIDFGFRHAAFFPKERTGGENSPGARINLNSGVLNPNLLSHRFHPQISAVWEKGRLRDRIDAVTVHEDIEGRKVAEGQDFHTAQAAAAALGPETPRPITAGARHILRVQGEPGKPPERS
jgi:hypothetical protein